MCLWWDSDCIERASRDLMIYKVKRIVTDKNKTTIRKLHVTIHREADSNIAVNRNMGTTGMTRST
jgi:hypothetical protein